MSSGTIWRIVGFLLIITLSAIVLYYAVTIPK